MSGAVCAQGLGKTVQTIAFCAALLAKTGTSSDSLALARNSARYKPVPCRAVQPVSRCNSKHGITGGHTDVVGWLGAGLLLAVYAVSQHRRFNLHTCPCPCHICVLLCTATAQVAIPNLLTFYADPAPLSAQHHDTVHLCL